jgi:dipeptidyl aminopeptidase/acylaminoacyl peptidase
MGALTLEDVLNIKYLGKFEWSPSGPDIAFIWDDGGVFDLFLQSSEGGAPRKISCAREEVADFSFNPVDGRLAFTQDGTVYSLLKGQGTPYPWFRFNENVSSVAWSPDGMNLAMLREGKIAVLDAGKNMLKEFKVPGRVGAGGPDGKSLAWAPDGRLMAFAFADEKKDRFIGVCDLEGNLIYRTIGSHPAASPQWLDANTLYYAVLKERGTAAEFCTVEFEAQPGGRVKAGKPNVFYSIQGDGRGNVFSTAAYPSPDGKTVLFLLENDGWLHLYAYYRATGEMRQLSTGAHEDFAYAGDEPSWAPDSRHAAFSSSNGDLHERHIWVVDVSTGAMGRRDDLPGTNGQAKWSPDGSKILFAHADVYRNLDLWVMDAGSPANPRQLTYSMPANWTPANISVAEHVTYKGALDWDIHGFVTRPAEFDPSKKYPALVWVHGGPVRQMRQGFHPLHSYGVFHAFHQYLAQKGYVSISINFRGGTGYGRAFRTGLFHKMGVDDVTDVVNAGKYLKSLPYVDADRVAVWGLSYGGYMTLHSMTQYPDVFAMGINVAGIWDFTQWTRWVQSRRGSQGGLFVTYFGGFPEESPELYRIGSPYAYAENLKNPLINFMGTADANVDFEQMDRIVMDCVKLGKKYEAYYYPKEVHMFRWRQTWADAFPKIEREFEKHLGK